MQVIVVWNRALVFVINLTKEKQELLVVDQVAQVVLSQKCGGYEGHLHLPTHLTLELKNVELEAVNSLKVGTVSVHGLLDDLRSQFLVD